jgi:hypothetical protein
LTESEGALQGRRIHMRKAKGKRVIWSSEKGSTVDALELSGEEGRGKLRKAAGRSKHPVNRRWPNGVTRPVGLPVTGR